MALGNICGMDKRSFMKAYSDDNALYAQLEMKRAKTVFDNPYALLSPPFENPMKQMKKVLKKSGMKLDLTHGTTTLGFKYRGGIILCADSRGTNSEFIATQEMKKVIEIDPNILGTIAGAAADCVYWDRILTMECRLHTLTYGRAMPVTSAARILCNIAFKFKDMGLCMGMILAGYDIDGPKLIYIDSEGLRTEGELFATGSGTSYALGVLDTFFRWDMSDEEAYNLALRGIYHATYLDAYTGGLVRLYHIKREGWSLVTIKDCMQLAAIFANAMKEDPHGGSACILKKGYKMDPKPMETNCECKKKEEKEQKNEEDEDEDEEEEEEYFL